MFDNVERSSEGLYRSPMRGPVNRTVRTVVPPPGVLWFLRDAIPVASLQSFDIGQITSSPTSALRNKIHGMGGADAWCAVVASSRCAIDDLLAIPMSEALSQATANMAAAASPLLFERTGVLDVICSGTLIQSWEFSTRVQFEVLVSNGGRKLVAAKVKLLHNTALILDAPRVEGWVH